MVVFTLWCFRISCLHEVERQVRYLYVYKEQGGIPGEGRTSRTLRAARLWPFKIPLDTLSNGR
jgi:hypothetical protein